jgi:V/A-type H+-transporting ATPase subunit E
MATDVAEFARQLKEEGIEAAKKEAESIIAEAKAKAGEILAEAKSSAEKFQQVAQEEIARNRQRSEAELGRTARDLILGLKSQVEQVAAVLLREQVGQAFAMEEVVKAAIMELVRTQKTGRAWELALGPTVGKTLAEAVVADLFRTAGAEVKLGEGFKRAGFELRVQGESEVIEVSDASVAEAFRRLLSPELQKILDAKVQAR